MNPTKLFSLLLVFLIATTGTARKIHTIGDSTMANYDEEATVTRGWAMYLQQFLRDIEVNNRGKGGASSKSFYREQAYWQSVKRQLEPGDYVFIQFAHNDEKNGGADGDSVIAFYRKTGNEAGVAQTDYRGTTPFDSYRTYLKQYVTETRAQSCTPVFVTPVCRMYFTNGKIRRNGRHDLGDKFTKVTPEAVTEKNKIADDDHTMDYAWQMKEVAKEMSVPVIDLTEATRELFESYGDSRCHTLLSDGDGSTHLSTLGATLIARLCAQKMQQAGILTENINLTSDLSVSPAAIDFGDVYLGQAPLSELTVNGFGLSPLDGDVTVTAGNGLTVSPDKEGWTGSQTLHYTGGTLIGSVYVKPRFTEEGPFSGEITVSKGDKSVTIPVTASVMSRTGGTRVKAVWHLEDNAACTLEGPAQPLEQSWSNMYVQKYASPGAKTVWPANTAFDSSRKTQRNLIKGDIWPEGEIDEVSDRFIQFAITPVKGTTLKIDSIGMYLCGSGGNGMMCHVNYSTKIGFADQHTIFASSSMPNSTMLPVTASTAISVPDNDTLRLRIYPWYDGTASGKTICLSDVAFYGRATTNSEESGNGSLTWNFNDGSSRPEEAVTDFSDLISTSSCSFGKNLSVAGTVKCGDKNMNKLQPLSATGKTRDEASVVKFTFTPKRGVSFRPSSLSFNAAKIGTNGGTMDIVALRGDRRTTVTEGFNPYRANDKDETTPEYSSGTFALPVAGNDTMPLEILFYIYNLAANKQLALSDITIEGTFTGKPVKVPSYTMSVSSGNEIAGEAVCNPSGNSFDEGTVLTVTASEKFGYSFDAWLNEKGDTVSTANPYSFSISGNTSLTAVYTKYNTFALNISLTGGAQPYLVSVTPEGHMVNGVRYYKEDSDVRLTAAGNRILTFTGWEDNTTNPDRVIRMNRDYDIVASYSATDYIVGWDFYNSQPSSERAADYKSDSENSGLLTLRNASGETTSWLPLGTDKGGQNGKYGARIWRKLSEGWYFELTCSSRDFTNIVLSAALGNDYNSYSIVNAQYSTDGNSYTTFGSFNIPARSWTQQELPLPADASDKAKLYIRFMPDKSSPLTGVVSDYDGLSVAELFVIADKKQVMDDQPPVLVSMNPADKSEGVSADGAIVLTFNERIVRGSGNAMLGNTVLTPVISGKTIVYKYGGLDYNKSYTFTLPAGAVTDRSGNPCEDISTTFRVMDRRQPELRIFDAVVAQDGTGDFSTIQAAVDAAPEGMVKPWLIYIKKGEYKEHIDIPASKPYLHFTGQHRDSVIITDDKLSGGDNALHVSVGATVVVKSDNCYFDNLTFENAYGHDKQQGPQALALNTMGDRTIFKNVAMLSYQDTWITPSQSVYRVYVTKSLIEGAVDFIYNSGDVYIDNTTLYINRKSGGYIVAPSHDKDVKWGYVFRGCTITAPGIPSETDIWLGRPWHNFPKTVFIDTRAEVTIPAAGWYETMGGLPVLWADYNTTDGEGNPLDLSHRRDTYYYVNESGEKVYGKAKNFLTDEEAATYTVTNVLSGSDGWQPQRVTENCATPQPVVNGDRITWPAVPYAICYIITKNGHVEGFTTACECSFEKNNSYLIQAVNEFGGPTEAAAPQISDGIPATGTQAVGTPAMTFAPDGRKAGSNNKGLILVKQPNGECHKVIR